MPEVCDIRNYIKFIKPHILNCSIRKIRVVGGRYKKYGISKTFKSMIRKLPITIKKIASKGKLTCITLSNGYYMLVTLGLTGGWIIKTGEKYIMVKFPEYMGKNNKIRVKEHAIKHINIEFELNNGKSLCFFDILSYGTFHVTNDVYDVLTRLKKIGPDIMEPETTFSIFRNAIANEKNSGRKIGNVLVDQALISGLGNYLRADILWLAKISPHRIVKNISNPELKRIFACSKFLTWIIHDRAKGIRLGYINSRSKDAKTYGKEFFIYSQGYDIHGNVVKKEQLYEGTQKRFIYWVPLLQK